MLHKGVKANRLLFYLGQDHVADGACYAAIAIKGVQGDQPYMMQDSYPDGLLSQWQTYFEIVA